MITAMDDISLLHEFENLAERLSVKIRYSNLDRDGGLCRVRGVYHLIVNRRLDTSGRIATISRALSDLPLDQVFLIPAIREVLDRYRSLSDE